MTEHQDGRERDPERLLPPATAADPAHQLGRGAETDPARLLPERAGEHLTHYPPHHHAHHPRHTARWLAGLLALVALYFGGMGLHDRQQEREHAAARARRMTGGDPARGPALIRAYGCGQCHTIPGVAGANSLVGPPLTGIAQRVYLAGVVNNTPDNMVRWIMNPKAVDPRTAMPYLGVTEAQARHIAAYLYTLR